MKFSAQQIAELLKGKVDGSPLIEVSALSKIEEGKPGTLSFLANPKYTEFIYRTKASVVIVNKDFVAEGKISATLIRVADAYKSFVQLLEIYNKIVNNKTGVEQPSFVDPSSVMGNDGYLGAFAYIGKDCKIGTNVKIYPHCYIGDQVTIGDNTTIYPGAKIYSFCMIGNNCTLHAGVIIGADGFGFVPNAENNYNKVPQIGNTIIEDFVEIGAGTTIDRATLGSTIIRKGVKLDNLIQIAHNVEVGENTVIAAQTGIAGSTKIGKNCMIGGQVGIVGHISIADGVKIAAQSGIGASITTANEIVQGSPAFNISDYKRTYVVFKKLPSIERKLNDIEKQIGVQNPIENKS